MRELGISAYQGNRAWFRILRAGEIKETPRKFSGWFWSIWSNLKIVRIVELLIIGQPKETHEYEIALDDEGHGRGDLVCPIPRDHKVNLINIEQFGINARDGRRLGLVVVVDKFD